MAEMKSPNAHAKKNRNDTPRKRKTHIIKVRVTAEEKLRIAYACKELHLTQSELVRRVLYGVNVKHTVVVAQGGEDTLAALAALSAQCSKVGSNLNQLARYFNSGGKDTEQLRAQILEELSALKGVEQVRIPQLGSALLVQNGQTGVLVVLKGEIAFGGGIVRVFRGHADCSRRLLTLEKIAEVIFYSQFGAAGLLLDGCHTVHQPFLRLSAESS